MSTHGMRYTRVYEAWVAMRKRCNCVTHAAYADYGGRGIRICRRWDKFENFYADMGDPPAGYSLERKNNDGNYTPRNCIWATMRTQCANRRSNVVGRYQGRRWIMSELAQAHGIEPRAASQRIKCGWTFVAACTTPVRAYRRISKERL